MSTRTVIMTSMIIFSAIGSFIPLLWGASLLSMASIFLTAVGGFFGIYVGYKMTR